MAFIDELTITAGAGRGGNGVVRWLHLKGKELSGPAGGNGGRGGDVFVSAVRNVNILSKYTGIKHFEAKNGDPGEGRGRHGKDGGDIVIDLPLGSIVSNLTTRERYDLLAEGKRVMILKGGRGGLGNQYFKSSVNRSPKESTPGTEGEEGTFHIELRLIADAGLIGLPNAGKSSLLNALTHARAKIGAYAFTTLDPNLGALYEFVLADIPGLIEGASEGKGLGHKFLKHIARTKMLLHCVSLESDDLLGRYFVVRSELEKWSPELTHKEELVILTKKDVLGEREVKKALALFRDKDIDAVATSVLDDEAVNALQNEIISRLRGG